MAAFAPGRDAASWNAFAARQERELGTLAAGMRADLVVLSDDVFTCDESQIKDVAPVKTLVGGEIVFSRPAG